MNSFDFLIENIPKPEWLHNVERFVHTVLEKLSIINWEFSITFCDNSYIHHLNKEYRSIDSPTDVLSFAQDGQLLPFEAAQEIVNAGDIIISLDTLKENAEYFGVDEEEELKRLIIHGVLHLNGMDHVDNSPREEMLIFQEKIMVELGEVKIF